MRVREHDAARGERIEKRRFDVRVTGVTDGVCAQGVDGDEDDVGRQLMVGGCRLPVTSEATGKRQQATKQEDEAASDHSEISSTPASASSARRSRRPPCAAWWRLRRTRA